jgi:hypothetical protein
LPLCLLFWAVVRDTAVFLSLFFRSSAALRAEVIFLRKQLTAYAERGLAPRHTADSEKLTMVLLTGLFAWRDALIVVKPRTLLGWRHEIGRIFWQ